MSPYATGQDLFYLLQPPGFQYASLPTKKEYYKFYLAQVKQLDPIFYRKLCREHYRRNPVAYIINTRQLCDLNKIRKR